MAQQLLRRPVRSNCTHSLANLPLPVVRPHRLSSHTRAPESLVFCTFQSPQQQQFGSRGLVTRQASDPSSSEFVPVRKETRLPIDKSPLLIDGTGDPRGLPRPTEYQQTLWCSFTIAGIGLHTGEYACVRVRPAFAGEGRYFVRVPNGTNRERADRELEEELTGQPQLDTGEQEELVEDPEYQQELIQRYQEYVDAQEEDGFGGSFVDFLEGQQHTELIERLRTEGPPAYPFSQPEPILPRAEDELYLPATADYVSSPNPVHTCLHNGEEGEAEFEVQTVETLLSALEACGVDNARIEIEGGVEVPVIDGTADGWARGIFRQGLRCAPPRDDLPVPGVQPISGATLLREQEAAEAAEEGEGAVEGEEEEEEEGEEGGPRLAPTPPEAVPKLVLRPQKVISVSRGSSFVTLYPEDSIRLTAGVDHQLMAPVIGSQWLTWCMFESVHYMHAIADARPFVVSPEQAVGMREAGWLQGGTEGCMLVGFGDRWYDQTVVRYADEPVRHQIQDMIGDLSLLSRNGHAGLPFGHVVSYNADHELYAAFVSRLLEETTDEDWVPMKDVAGASVELDYQEALKDVVQEINGEEGEEGEGAAEGAEGLGDEYYGDREEEAEAAEAMAEEGEYDEEEQEEEGGEFEEGDFEDEDDGGVVDVQATPVGPRKGRK